MRRQRGKRDEKPTPAHLVNERIRARSVRLITHEGENIGVVSCDQALSMALDAGLDLVQIGKIEDEVPVVKIMDYGKFLYERKKKQHEAKKHQKVIQIKEIKLRPNIGEQDYRIKLKHAIAFLQAGKKVKFTLQFKGREKIMMQDVGRKFFFRISKDLESEGVQGLIEEKETRSKHFWSKIVAIKAK